MGRAAAEPRAGPERTARPAIQILDAIPAGARDAEFYLGVAVAHEVWANHLDDAGQDSSVRRRQAIDACKQAIAIDERSSRAWLNLGESYSRRALQPHMEADGDLARAREALSRSRALDPTNVFAYLYEGVMYSRIARLERARGDDPGPDHARAIQSYQQGAAVSPGNSYFRPHPSPPDPPPPLLRGGQLAPVDPLTATTWLRT